MNYALFEPDSPFVSTSIHNSFLYEKQFPLSLTFRVHELYAPLLRLFINFSKENYPDFQ